jgi:hypothetical protein
VEASLEKRQGWNYGRSKDGKDGPWFTFYWQTPQLPAWALPEGEGSPAATGSRKAEDGGRNAPGQPPDEPPPPASGPSVQEKTEAAIREYIGDAATRAQLKSVLLDARASVGCGDITRAQYDRLEAEARLAASALPEDA